MFEKLLKVGIVFCVFCILAITAWSQLKLFLDDYFHRKTVPAPNITGIPLTKALRRNQEKKFAHLKIRVDREVFHDRLQRGYIISQDPEPGVPVQVDATMFVKVSKGSDFREIPVIKGKTHRKARLFLQKAQLRLGHVCKIRSRKVERGIVLAQYPAAGKRVAKRSPVDILLSEGFREKLVIMPRLLGLQRKRAMEILKEIGLERINIIERPTASDLTGLVIEHRPVGGIQIPRDQNVMVTVSAPMGSSENAKTIEVTYQIPPGLTEKLLEVAVSDTAGRRVIYRKRHMPGEKARVELTGRGRTTVQYFLDKVLVKEKTY